MFTLAEVLITLARSVSPPIFVCLYLCIKVDLYHCGIKSSLIYLIFRRPKHQSGENLVWPATINDSMMFSWSPVRTRHSRYPYHDVILVLTPTVVHMEVDVLLTEPMYFEDFLRCYNCSRHPKMGVVCPQRGMAKIHAQSLLPASV